MSTPANPDWDELVGQTYHRLYGVLWRWTRDHELAGELVEATYAATLSCATFDPTRPDAFGFLLRKAWWLVQSHRRQRARRRPMPAEVPDPAADRRWVEVEARDAVRSGVAGLAGTQRDVICRYLTGMTPGQIAHDMELPLKTVYAVFHQARRRLRNTISRTGRA